MVSPPMSTPPLSSTTVPSPPKAGAANYKPNRFGRPCDACKRRKQRCVFRDGQDDVCVMCEFQQVPCTFTEGGMAMPTPKKRGSGSADPTVVRKRRAKPIKYCDARILFNVLEPP